MPRKSLVRDVDRRAHRGMRYRGAHGKVIDWIEHSFEEQTLFIRVRFTDHTELSWSIRSAVVLQEADLSDWTAGNEKQVKIYTRGENNCQ